MEPTMDDLHEVLLGQSLEPAPAFEAVRAEAAPCVGAFDDIQLEVGLPLSPIAPLDWNIFNEPIRSPDHSADQRSPGEASVESVPSEAAAPLSALRLQPILPAAAHQPAMNQLSPIQLPPLLPPMPSLATAAPAAMRTPTDSGRRENKAHREKLRRNDLNERFNQLGAMLGVRVDKLSVLEHSMSTIAALRKHNADLKADADKVRAENAALVSLLRRVLPNGQVPCDVAAAAAEPLPTSLPFPKGAPFVPPVSFGLAPLQATLLPGVAVEEPVLHAPVA
eukprot:tig00020560_g11088.t1